MCNECNWPNKKETMKINKDVLNPLDVKPLIGQKCIMVMEKTMTYLGHDEDGKDKYKEDQNPATMKFIGWKLI